MPTLYEIAQEGAILNDLLTEAEGELTPDLEARFDAFLKGGRDKINAALHVRRNLEADAQACREEAARLSARARTFENQKDKLTERILIAVDFAFAGKLKTAHFTATGVNAKDTSEYSLAADVDIVELHKAHPDLVRMSVELNKSALNAVAKDGGAMPPEIVVKPVPGKRYLLIR